MGTQPIPLAVKGHSEIVHGSTPESPTHQRTPRARMRSVHINPGQSALQWASFGDGRPLSKCQIFLKENNGGTSGKFGILQTYS